MISVLYARRDSIYKTIPALDVWDIDRDARLFEGVNPVIAHPPCRAWSRLKHFAKPRPGEKQYAIDCVSIIRCNGGVLEHPAGSSLWKELSLPQGLNRDRYGGFTLSIDQSWFGHLARKRTYLYICGIDPGSIPAYPLSLDRPVVRNVSQSSTKVRESTPLAFAKWLVDLVEIIQHNRLAVMDSSTTQLFKAPAPSVAGGLPSAAENITN